MGIFKRRRSGVYVPEQGLDTRKRTVEFSAPFNYVANTPAVDFGKLDLSKTDNVVDLEKSYEASYNALSAINLMGIRLQIIVLCDGSGSMREDYRKKRVQRMLVRSLGYSLNVDADGSIPVIIYGGTVAKEIKFGWRNYEQAGDMLRPDYGTTDMAGAFRAALALIRKSEPSLTMLINITDGNPYKQGDDNPVLTKNQVMDTSGTPTIVKNLAIRPVPFLADLDDMPSQHEYRKDASGQPLRDNGKLIIEHNDEGIRHIDNVDSQSIDPMSATDDEFAAAITEEIGPAVEMMGHGGQLTGVPGIQRLF